MDKKTFFKSFENENDFLLAILWENLNLCLNINFPVSTNYFFSPQIWKNLNNILPNFNLKLSLIGLQEECEKKLIIFSPSDYNDEIEKNIILFKICGKNKFKNLEHKDFLGTIMSIGIKRETLGDIFVKNNTAYSITTEKIYNILKKEISHVNKIPVIFSECTESNIPNLEFKTINETISSLRLDNFVSSILKISRNIAVSLIENGEVFLNYQIQKDKSKYIKEKDIITIRKKGKFIFSKIFGETKKGNLKISVKQYI